MGFIVDVENCWDCPYRQANVDGKVPHYCRLGRTCMSDADFPKYCPLSKKVEINAAKQGSD